MSARPVQGVPAGARKLQQNGYAIYLVGDDRRPYLRDAYHTFLRIPWGWSLLILSGLFLVINLVFAGIYLVVGGVEGIHDGSFFDAMSFSVQTMSTIGYGVTYPKSGPANAVMIVEAVASIIVTALATGLVFAKFSRPSARIQFSTNAVIGTHDGKPTLMFRIGNRRGNTIFDAQIHCVCSKLITTAEGEKFYKMFDIELVRDRQIGLKRGWNVMHVVDDTSPLYGLDRDSLTKAEVEMQISLSGIDDTSMQSVTVVHEYADSQILFGRRFADTLTPLANGDLIYDQTKFDQTVPAGEPRDSVRA